MGTKELVKAGAMSIEDALLLVPEGTRTHYWLTHTAASRAQAKVSERPADKKGKGKRKRKRKKFKQQVREVIADSSEIMKGLE